MILYTYLNDLNFTLLTFFPKLYISIESINFCKEKVNVGFRGIIQRPYKRQFPKTHKIERKKTSYSVRHALAENN